MSLHNRMGGLREVGRWYAPMQDAALLWLVRRGESRRDRVIPTCRSADVLLATRCRVHRHIDRFGVCAASDLCASLIVSACVIQKKRSFDEVDVETRYTNDCATDTSSLCVEMRRPVVRVRVNDIRVSINCTDSGVTSLRVSSVAHCQGLAWIFGGFCRLCRPV